MQTLTVRVYRLTSPTRDAVPCLVIRYSLRYLNLSPLVDDVPGLHLYLPTVNAVSIPQLISPNMDAAGQRRQKFSRHLPITSIAQHTRIQPTEFVLQGC
jgi:hypothetical protein